MTPPETVARRAQEKVVFDFLDSLKASFDGDKRVQFRLTELHQEILILELCHNTEKIAILRKLGVRV